MVKAALTFPQKCARSARRAVSQTGKHAQLVAALIAPISTLLDIPALTQKWYSYQGQALEDPYQSLVLSAISLAANIAANALLVLRFSVTANKLWKWSTRASLACWFLKSTIAIVNLIVFGALTRNGEGYAYLEGFWCAVISCIAAGIVTLLLTMHYIVRFRLKARINQARYRHGRGLHHRKQRSEPIGKEQQDINDGGELGETPAPATARQSLWQDHHKDRHSLECEAQGSVTDHNGTDTGKHEHGDNMKRDASGQALANIRQDPQEHEHAEREAARAKEIKMRLRGRGFILSELLLFGILALQALAFSRIEGWPYFDGVYFSVVTMLLIGFGDLLPTTAGAKVLLFPFTIVTVGLLTNLISLIVSALQEGRTRRRDRWRVIYEKQFHERALALEVDARSRVKSRLSRVATALASLPTSPIKKSFQAATASSDPKNAEGAEKASRESADDAQMHPSTLIEEMERLEKIHRAEEHLLQLYDLLLSFLLLVTFWVVGAAIFASVEGWGYGDGIYLCVLRLLNHAHSSDKLHVAHSTYVTFLTLGFGDYTPHSPAGKVIFIVYAMLAIPIISFFVLQTFTGVVASIAQVQKKFSKATKPKPPGRALHSHAELVSHFREDLQTQLLKSPASATDIASMGKQKQDKPGGELAEQLDECAEEAVQAVDKPRSRHDRRELLLDAALGTACLLEAQARALLLKHLEPGSTAATLLRADLQMQHKAVAELGMNGDRRRAVWKEAQEEAQRDSEDDLEQIRRYR
jgi:Ion channel